MDYTTKTRDELLALCKENQIKGCSSKNKTQLIELLQLNQNTPPILSECAAETSQPQVDETSISDDEDKDEDEDEETSTTNIIEKIDLYKSEDWLNSKRDAEEYENTTAAAHYKHLFCLKPTNSKVQQKNITAAYKNIEKFISNPIEEVLSNNPSKLCVLRKDHKGKCCAEPKIFKKNKLTDKLKKSITQCISQAPGNDDLVYKNRSSRTFPIPLSKKDEKKIRDKKIKLKCAIPMCEYSTPFMIATAYVDWMCYVCSVSDIAEHINPVLSEEINAYKSTLLNEHKQFIIGEFKKHNRTVFDSDGNTICAITKAKIITKNISDITRDNRVEIEQEDIQMGHIISRTDRQFTTRGLNVVMMSREGNRIIGEDNFEKNDWLVKLEKIVDNNGGNSKLLEILSMIKQGLLVPANESVKMRVEALLPL